MKGVCWHSLNIVQVYIVIESKEAVVVELFSILAQKVNLGKKEIVIPA